MQLLEWVEPTIPRSKVFNAKVMDIGGVSTKKVGMIVCEANLECWEIKGGWFIYGPSESFSPPFEMILHRNDTVRRLLRVRRTIPTKVVLPAYSFVATIRDEARSDHLATCSPDLTRAPTCPYPYQRSYRETCRVAPQSIFREPNLNVGRRIQDRCSMLHGWRPRRLNRILRLPRTPPQSLDEKEKTVPAKVEVDCGG